MAVGWLVEWTNKHGLWRKTTKEVVDEIVRPATEATRWRYVELPSVKKARIPKAVGEKMDVVGPADVFVSHAWSARWGDLARVVILLRGLLFD